MSEPFCPECGDPLSYHPDDMPCERDGERKHLYDLCRRQRDILVRWQRSTRRLRVGMYGTSEEVPMCPVCREWPCLDTCELHALLEEQI